MTITPKKHQIECLNKIEEDFKIDNKGLIKMFCGAGKSFLIYICLLKYGLKLSVVVVPSINLITQFNEDYFLSKEKQEYNDKYYDKKFKLMTVCSKNELSDKTKYPLDLNVTTNEESILKFLKIDDNKIVLITYQSLDILVNIIKQNSMKIDLMCFDEAHHILGENMKKLLFGVDYNEDDYSDIDSDDNLDDDDMIGSFIDDYVNKSLFFTATPKNSNGIKMYEPITNITIDDNEYDIEDDEDTYDSEELHCGKMIYEYMHTNGVNDNILNDFNIRVDLYTENTDKSIFEAISRSILETGNNRVLTFHSRSNNDTKTNKGSNIMDFSDEDNKKEFKKCFDNIVKYEFPKLKKKYKNIEFKGITANTKNRKKILEEFDSTKDDEIFILASCKTLGEGIDTKRCNQIVFVDPKQSYIEIVQNIGRVCRKQDNISTVLIPTYVDVNKYKDCKTIEDKDKVIRNEMSKTGNFNGILNVLSALRQEDPYMFEMCLKYPELYSDKEINDNLYKNGLVMKEKEYNKKELFEKHEIKYDKKISEKENFEKLAEKVDKNVQIINNKVLEEDIYINNDSEETMYLVKKKDDIYVETKGKVKSNKKIEKPNRNIKPFVHANDDIQVLWEIDGEIDLSKKLFGGYIKATVIPSSEEKFDEMIKKVSDYIDKNKKRPNSMSKNKDIKKLGTWLVQQQCNYIKKIFNMKKNNILNIWKKFIDKYKEYFICDKERWIINLNNVIEYININKKKPSCTDKNIDIKQMGSWLSNQQKNYKEKTNIMKNQEICKLWENFIKQYKEYFLDNKMVWKNMLSNVKKYININKKRPICTDNNIDISKMGHWLIMQQQNYKKNDRIMKNENIRKEWEQFIKDYSKYVLDNELEWKNMLNNIKKYINENKKRPSSKDKNENIKKMGLWITNQIKNYKNNDRIMKNEDIKKEWEKFIKEYKEYFLDNESEWKNILFNVKKYININKKRPSNHEKNIDVKQMGSWLSNQVINYKEKTQIMKDPEIRKLWEEFITEYQQYFPNNPAIKEKQPDKKSTTIKQKEDKPKETDKEKRERIQSEYQELTKKMSIQKSDKTNEMFKDDSKLWHQYHDNRDFSFKGYDNQDEIPVNKIISYLEERSNKKLKILDLGCGRNIIKKHFEDNKKFEIIGYDHVSFNGSIACDISNLPDEDETVDICIFSQSLMGSNWKKYIDEAVRVLRYNGEMIVSESVERYEKIKEYINKLGLHIKQDNYVETNRWFYLHVLNYKVNEKGYNK